MEYLTVHASKIMALIFYKNKTSLISLYDAGDAAKKTIAVRFIPYPEIESKSNNIMAMDNAIHKR
jgi:hypothetical protein